MEGDGTLLGAGTVWIPGTYASDVVVQLDCDDATELAVPATATISVGDTSSTFDVVILDDAETDGTQSATVTPALAGWTGIPDTMDVLDNETLVITVTLPASATEGESWLTGLVAIPGTYATDVVIALESSDTTELTVPATVSILQGDTSAAFDMAAWTDGVHDGPQTVTVTATAEGWVSGSANIDILDTDPAPRGGGGCTQGTGSAAPIALFAFALAGVLAWARRPRRWMRSP
jgi:hypothetical protein